MGGLKDKFWIWGHSPNSCDSYNVGTSDYDVTPAECARYFGAGGVFYVPFGHKMDIDGYLADTEGVAVFSASGNRNSTLGEGSYKKKVEEVPLITVDGLNVKTDYIKYDVEGAEKAALLGSEKTIKGCRPYLTVSVYHRNEDIFALPLLCEKMAEKYRFYLRRTPSLPAWELRLIGVPTEKAVSEYGEGENHA